MKTNKRPNGTRMRRNMKNSRSGTKGEPRSAKAQKKKASGYRKFQKMKTNVLNVYIIYHIYKSVIIFTAITKYSQSINFYETSIVIYDYRKDEQIVLTFRIIL